MEGKGFFLFVGNGGGVEFTFDGETKGVLGKSGKVLRVRFPALVLLPETAVEEEAHGEGETGDETTRKPAKDPGEELF